MNDFHGSVTAIKTATGRTRFDATITFQGRRERKRFVRRREAELWLQKMQVEAAEGQFLKRPERVSLLHLVGDFLSDSQARKSKGTFLGVDATRLLRFTRFLLKEVGHAVPRLSAKRFADLVMSEEASRDMVDHEQHLVRFMGSFKLQRVDLPLLEKYQRSLLQEVKPISARDYIITLKVALNHALKQSWLPENPANRLNRIDVPKKLPRFLLKGEIALLLRSATQADYFGWVATAIFAGLRRGELAHLEWTDLDLENGWIMIRAKPELDWAPKRRRERNVPLEPLLREVLLPLRPSSNRGLCFPNKDGQPRGNNVVRDMKQLCIRAGIKHAPCHSLRHTYGSHMAMAGVPLTDVRDWMGHSSIEVTEIYAHLAPGRNRFRRDSVFEFQKLEELLELRPPGEVTEMPNPKAGDAGQTAG